MALLDFFLSRKKNTANIAKERLQIIVAERRRGDAEPHYLPQLRKDILEVICKYPSRPCSSQVYQVTPTSASIATSSRRRPGVRRRPTRGNPRRCGSRLSRRARRKAPSCLRRSSGTAIVDSRCGIVVITPPA